MDFDDHNHNHNHNHESEHEHDEEEMADAAKMLASAALDAPPIQAARRTPRYRECLKNHAVGLGAHAVDGCGEFLPAGPEGSLDALKCAACSCHRNFHRKDTMEAPAGGGSSAIVSFSPHQHHQGHQGHQFFPHHHPQQAFSPYYRSPAGYLQVTPTSQRPLALPSSPGGGGGSHSRGEEMEDMSNPSSFGGGISGSSKKRYRTKFTPDQKDKMLGFAESLGWRIQRQDDEAVDKFCNDTGIKRQVLKVWMHNNKHTLGKKP